MVKTAASTSSVTVTVKALTVGIAVVIGGHQGDFVNVVGIGVSRRFIIPGDHTDDTGTGINAEQTRIRATQGIGDAANRGGTAQAGWLRW